MLLDFTLNSGLNLYSYCKNNPINYSDLTGTRPTWEIRHSNGLMEYADCGTGTPVKSVSAAAKTAKSTTTASYGYSYSGQSKMVTDSGTGTPMNFIVDDRWCRFENSSSFVGLRFNNNSPLRRLGWYYLNKALFLGDLALCVGSATKTIGCIAAAPVTSGASLVAAPMTLSLLSEAGVHAATNGAGLLTSFAYLYRDNSFYSSVGISKDTGSLLLQVFVIGAISVE